MPLLTSPIDGSTMKQIHRYGIEIDVCPTSGGIWLDKGELEKLMAFLKEETENEALGSRHAKADERPDRPYQGNYRDDGDDDDDDRYDRDRGGGYRKKSKMSRIMDIFDF